MADTHPAVQAAAEALRVMFHTPGEGGWPGHGTIAEKCWDCNNAAAAAAPAVLRHEADQLDHLVAVMKQLNRAGQDRLGADGVPLSVEAVAAYEHVSKRLRAVATAIEEQSRG